MIKAMLLAGCGGFVGTCGRYLVGKWCAGMWHGSFPMGTFLVNIIGCFIIGLFFGLLEKAHVMTPGENVLLITGFCGGFTTFSSFADDMWVLGSKGDWTTFILYLALSVILGLAPIHIFEPTRLLSTSYAVFCLHKDIRLSLY